MTCEKCGTNINEGEKLCAACKASIAASKKATAYAKTLRSLLNTPVFYVAVIATLFGMLFRISSVFSITNAPVALAEALVQVDHSVDLSAFVDRISNFMNQYGDITVLLGLLTQIPLLLQTVGLLFLSMYIIREKGPQGLNLIRVGIMIEVIFLAILAMIAVLGCIFGLVAGNYAGDGFLNVMIALTVVTAIVFILIFCYKGALIRLTDYAERALSGKRHPGSGPSAFLVGMTFISAIISLLGMLAITVSPADSALGLLISAFSGQSMTTIIVNVCSILSISLFGVLLSQVRKTAYEAALKSPAYITPTKKRPPHPANRTSSDRQETENPKELTE